ncbi:MAG: dihydrodipicolinate reductase [Pseudomonadota bacterium]
MARILTSILTAAALSFAASSASAFEQINRADQFVAAISGKALTRVGIRLTVSPGGEIQGRAFGRPVSGDWSWQDGYFCRDLRWGQKELGYNCQMVQRDGTALRFTSDRGEGMYADLWLR